MKDLQRWKTDNGSDFASCVERVMAATDVEPRSGPGMTLDELDEIMDRVAALSPFSSANLKESVERIFSRLAGANDLLSEVDRKHFPSFRLLGFGP